MKAARDWGKQSWLGFRSKLVAPTLLGLVFSLFFLGSQVIDPRQDEWLLIDQVNLDRTLSPTGEALDLNGMDRTSHYIGWRFFSEDDWRWPLGLNPDNGLELSNSIVYSDSIPLMAIPAKLVAGLGLEFQYFGLWLVLCFVMQAIIAYQIIGLFRNDLIFRLSGTALVLLSPILLWRVTLHMALGAHFLILAAIYLSLQNKRTKHFWWLVLLSMAVMTHFYLLIMVGALWFADMLSRLRSQITPLHFLAELVAGIFAVCILAYICGYFTIASGVGDRGFGYFSTNLASPFVSLGFGRLSLPIPVASDQVEGFAYLGAGGLACVFLALFALLSRRTRISIEVKKLLPLAGSILGLALLAVSNRLSFGLHVYELPLPDALQVLAALVRSSGRMIWPLIYALLLGSIWIVGKTFSKKMANFILVGLVLAQLFDLSPGIAKVRRNLDSTRAPQITRLANSPFMSCLSNKYDNVRWLIPFVDAKHWREISLYALDSGMATDAVYLARIDHVELNALHRKDLAAIESGTFEPKTLYFVGPRFIDQVQSSHDPTRDGTFLVDGIYVLAPGMNDCPSYRP